MDTTIGRKLVGIDLDGTLFSDDGLISDANLDGLLRAKNNNAIIVIATGRPFVASLNVIENYNFDFYLICHNGGLIHSIGNYYNDIEMFKASGVGIAVANSPDDVKEHADYITQNSNNEDGVLEALEKFIFHSL